MKKCLALVLVFGLMAGIASGEEFSAWDIEERILPELKDDFLKMPAMEINAETLPALRKAFVPSSLPKDEGVKVYDEVLASGLRVRVYVPAVEAEKYPALLWIHGGGHILGMPEQDEALLLRIAKEAGCIIAAPDYRLAPKHPYPADIDDCYEALVWMTEKLPVRKDKVAVAGDSAGGGLTAALALRIRDYGGPALCFQMPLYPMLDCRNITPSISQIVDHRVWNRDFNVTAWRMYLGDGVRGVSEYASPALAEDLSDLPPTYIMVG